MIKRLSFRFLPALFYFLFYFFQNEKAFSQNNNVGIGTLTPDASAVLDLVPPNSDKGLLVPRLTTVQRNIF